MHVHGWNRLLIFVLLDYFQLENSESSSGDGRSSMSVEPQIYELKYGLPTALDSYVVKIVAKK